MLNGKIRYEILIGSILLVVGFASIIVLYVKVSGDIALLDLSRIETRATMQNLAFWLILLSMATLFLDAIAGYLIGKYLQVK